MSDRPTITAAVIALDEQRNLAALLPALDWADQIVVVDGGSRDATASIARRHGCRVTLRRFDTFARQRNHALRLATGDWVLSIDADERPTPRLVAEIRSRIARSSASAFRVPIRSRIFGRSVRRSGTQDDCPVRLFRRRAARWTGDVHEVLRVSGQVSRLHHWLIHRTTPDLETFLVKMHRYARLEAQHRAAAGRRPAWTDTWIAPPREIFRRLVYKQGLLDGPAGWAFCLLSGLSEWVLAREHRRLAQLRYATEEDSPQHALCCSSTTDCTTVTLRRLAGGLARRVVEHAPAAGQRRASPPAKRLTSESPGNVGQQHESLIPNP